MVTAMKPSRIVGNWIYGVALDVHTISSTHMGVNEFGYDVFDNKRSELGELLYRMKYQGDRSAACEIIEAAVAFLARSRNRFDVLVPVPPLREPACSAGANSGERHRRGIGAAGC